MSSTLLDVALYDLRNAKDSLKYKDEYGTNQAAFHISQAIEKALKFLIMMEGHSYAKTHSIEDLAALISKYKNMIPLWVVERSYQLLTWSSAARYKLSAITSYNTVDEVLILTEDWILDLIQKFKDDVEPTDEF